MSNFDDALNNDDNVCQRCGGTGEGRTSESSCTGCGGTGIGPRGDSFEFEDIDDDFDYWAK